MNFLAHLHLAGNDEGLRLGAMLGDFIRGRHALADFEEDVQLGIRLHRHIDAFTDSRDRIAQLRAWFQAPFRRYSGIIIDLAFDHLLARQWHEYSDQTLEEFDRGIRVMLSRYNGPLPDRLLRFMAYADRRGLFSSYRERSEILRSLTGIGKRLSRENPLHRSGEIWDDFLPEIAAVFPDFYTEVQSSVEDWLKRRSTTTGS